MNKTEMAQALVSKLDFVKTQKNANLIIDAFCDIIGESLRDGDSVQIMGFGKFKASLVKGREGKNPQDPDSTITIPDLYRIYFSSGQALKDKVNESLKKSSKKKAAAPAKAGKKSAPAKKSGKKKK